MNRSEVLRDLERELTDLGYDVVASSHEPDMLHVTGRNDGEPMRNVLVVGAYPDDELGGSWYVQFYFELPFAIDAANDDVYRALSDANRRLTFGHFNVSADGSTVHYRHVLVAPRETGVDRGVLVDVMDMAIYLMETVAVEFEVFARERGAG